MARGDTVINLETALYVIQKKSSKGEWISQSTHVYRGRSDASTVLHRLRQKHPKDEWRQILKQEAERYREGWKDCLDYVRSTYGLELKEDTDEISGNAPRSGVRGARRSVPDSDV